MGLRFLDSILALVATAAVVFSAYLIGHALSSDHAAWAWVTAAGLIVGGVALGAFTARRIRTFAEERGEELRT